MVEVRVFELTEIHRLLDNIKEPTQRVKDAKERVLDELLCLVEGMSSWSLTPRNTAAAARAVETVKRHLDEMQIPKNTA